MKSYKKFNWKAQTAKVTVLTRLCHLRQIEIGVQRFGQNVEYSGTRSLHYLVDKIIKCWVYVAHTWSSQYIFLSINSFVSRQSDHVQTIFISNTSHLVPFIHSSSIFNVFSLVHCQLSIKNRHHNEYSIACLIFAISFPPISIAIEIFYTKKK